MLKKVVVLLVLSGCSVFQTSHQQQVLSDYIKLENKLRLHFSGCRQGDISTLSRDAIEMATRLRRANMHAEANRFESYADVLIYGNQTLEESMQDVFNLVNGKVANQTSESTLFSFFKCNNDNSIKHTVKKGCQCGCCKH